MDNNTINPLSQQTDVDPQQQQADVNQQMNYQQSDMTQQMYTQQPYNQQMYTQQPNMSQQMYTQQPNMSQQMYTQQPYNQQMYTQQPYGQQMYAQQPYGQQMGYQQPKQPSKTMENIKDVQSQFKNKVSKMGLSTFCLIGIIAAMLLIVGPFMNFASIHLNQKYQDDGVKVRIKVSDGLNLFELSKASNTVDNLIDEMEDYYQEYYDDDYEIDKDDIVDSLDDSKDYLVEEIEDETDMNIKKSVVKEVIGTAHLIIDGKLPLIITPWLIIISGVGLLIFTVINNKKMKLVCSIIPLVCLVWLMICSSDFFTIIGIGAWAIIVASILGIISAIKDQPMAINS